MKIEPPVLHKCPKCDNGICLSNIMSCNTFGATFWTDGRIEGDMYAENEWLVKCYHCNTLWWSEELERTDERCFEGVSALEQKDYLLKLKDTTINEEQEMHLRVLAWRAGNDKRRKSNNKKPLSKKEIKNMKALIQLLDKNDDSNRINMVELYRELGSFKKAEVLLEKDFKEDFTNIVSQMRSWIQQQNPYAQIII